MNHPSTLQKHRRAPTVKRLLRERGYNLTDVARLAGVHKTLVSRVVRKQATSARVWTVIEELLREPEPANVA